jgi:acetyl-CoA carboxylase biotin carboxyl carrier protein
MAIVDVKAEITGSVWKIVVKVGDRVTEDQPLVILESMKMEIPLMATEDGVVTEMLAVEGAAVAEGAVLVRLEV